MLRVVPSTSSRSLTYRPITQLPQRGYAGGGHGNDHGHHGPPLYKPRDEWDDPRDAQYWHDMLPTVKVFNKELAVEEPHSSFYLQKKQVAKPGVYDELRAQDKFQLKLEEKNRNAEY